MTNGTKTATGAWRVAATRSLYDNGFFRLRYDECVLSCAPSVKANLYVLESPDTVSVVSLTKDGNLVVIEQYRHAFNARIIDFPGGTIDPSDRTREDAAIRELAEETGYIAENLTYLGAFPLNPSGQTSSVHMYVATGCMRAACQNLESFEDIEVTVRTPAELLAAMRIGMAINVNVYAALLLAAMHGFLPSLNLRGDKHGSTSCCTLGLVPALESWA